MNYIKLRTKKSSTIVNIIINNVEYDDKHVYHETALLCHQFKLKGTEKFMVLQDPEYKDKIHYVAKQDGSVRLRYLLSVPRYMYDETVIIWETE